MGYFFINIPKTGGTSIRAALGHERAPHYWAAKAIEEIGQEEWDERFTFTFVRNPFDRVVSQYHFQLQKTPHVLYKHLQGAIDEDEYPMDFKVWVQIVYGEIAPILEDLHWGLRPQTDWFMDGDKKLVDYVGRFEKLQNDFAFVCNCIGFPPNTKLPHHKKSEHAKWWTYYDDATMDVVAEYFARDMQVIGW